MDKVRRTLANPPMPESVVIRTLNHSTGEIMESQDFAGLVQSTALSVAYSLKQQLEYGKWDRIKVEFELSSKPVRHV